MGHESMNFLGPNSYMPSASSADVRMTIEAGVPLITRHLIALSSAGVDDVVVVTGHARERRATGAELCCDAVYSVRLAIRLHDSVCARAEFPRGVCAWMHATTHAAAAGNLFTSISDH